MACGVAYWPEYLHHTIPGLSFHRCCPSSVSGVSSVASVTQHASRAPARPLARLGRSSKINHRYGMRPWLLIGGLSRRSHHGLLRGALTDVARPPWFVGIVL